MKYHSITIGCITWNKIHIGLSFWHLGEYNLDKSAKILSNSAGNLGFSAGNPNKSNRIIDDAASLILKRKFKQNHKKMHTDREISQENWYYSATVHNVNFLV